MILTTVTSSKPLKPIVSGRRAIFLSDLHLLHPNTPTFIIASNVMDMLTRVVTVGKVDAIYILGDLFDERGVLDNKNTRSAVSFLNELLYFCAGHNIALICMEGTPKHDRKQSKLLTTLNEKIGANYKYFDEVTVYKEPALDLVVGLIPDEVSSDAKDTVKIFKKLMNSKGYKKVDVLGMHGLFHFQIPHIFSKANFDERTMESLVNYCIVIGHDHKEKLRGKIRVSGSCEVLNHGEVGRKGVTVIDFTDGKASAYFVLNNKPCPYLTVNGVGKSDEEIIIEVEKAIVTMKSEPYGKHGKLRVSYPHDSDIRPLLRSLSEKNDISITPHRLTDKNKIRKINEVFSSRSQDEIHLDPKTITKLLKGRIKNCAVTDSILTKIEERLC